MSERRKIEVELFRYGYSDETMPLAEFATLINDALASVPTEYLASAVFVVDTGWGDSSSSMKGKYVRPETDEEVAKREATSRAYDAQREMNELLTFRRLKAKFEGP